MNMDGWNGHQAHLRKFSLRAILFSLLANPLSVVASVHSCPLITAHWKYSFDRYQQIVNFCLRESFPTLFISNCFWLPLLQLRIHLCTGYLVYEYCLGFSHSIGFVKFSARKLLVGINRSLVREPPRARG